MAAAACLSACAAAAMPPAPVAAHPQPQSLLDDADPTYAANKRLAFDMWRGIVNAGHTELADTLLREGYIQHSPVLPTGRAAFKQIFSAVPRTDMPDTVTPPLVALLAEGDLVVMAMREELPEPTGEGSYTSTHFNLFRVQAGQLAEHWHSVQGVPGPDVPSPDQGGPQPVVGAQGAAQQQALLRAADPALAANKRLVFDARREVFAAGREDLAARYFPARYVEHDPNGSGGLAGITARIAALPDARVPQSIPAPVVAIVAQGDLVVLATAQEHPHPSRAGATYTTTHFDMYRVEDSKLAEHWSGEMKTGGSSPWTN